MSIIPSHDNLRNNHWEVVYENEAIDDQIQLPHRNKHITLSGYGACEEIGNSSFLMNLSGMRILLDCGANPNSGRIPDLSPTEIRELNFVLLSHAHLDHCGLIPWLYEQGCQAPLLSTAPTLSVSKLLQQNSRSLDSKFRRLHSYQSRSINHALSYANVVNYNDPIELQDGTKVTYLNAGHSLGSAMTLIERDKRILYSGDVQTEESKLLRAAVFPNQIDTLILEGTYGNRSHIPRTLREEFFKEKVMTALYWGGTVVIPTFGYGRAQEVMMLLSECSDLGFNKEFPVYVDGMISVMNELHAHYLLQRDRDHGFSQNALSNAYEVLSSSSQFSRRVVNRDKLILDNQPKVIVTTSGMGAGPASYYLSRLNHSPKNLAFFVGHLPSNSKGSNMQNRYSKLRSGMEVLQVSLSAHSDVDQLLEAINGKVTGRLVLVHGDPDTLYFMKELAQSVLGSDIEVEVAKRGQLFNLS